MGRKESFIKYIKDACADASVGYSQHRRMRNPDVDCSSLVLLACNHAYGTIYTSGYTGTLKQQLEAAGFRAIPFNGTVSDAEPGEVYLNTVNHVETMVDFGLMGGAHIDENGDIAGRTGGDQTGNEVSIVPAYIYWAGWDWCLVPPDDADAPEPVPVVPRPSNTKDIDTAVKEVRAGLWGNNPVRAQRLTAAGYDAAEVQRLVNASIAKGNVAGGKAPASTDAAIDAAAWDIINYGTTGKYGNNPERSRKLTAEGLDADAVQARVNQLLGKS